MSLRDTIKSVVNGIPTTVEGLAKHFGVTEAQISRVAHDLGLGMPERFSTLGARMLVRFCDERMKNFPNAWCAQPGNLERREADEKAASEAAMKQDQTWRKKASKADLAAAEVAEREQFTQRNAFLASPEAAEEIPSFR